MGGSFFMRYSKEFKIECVKKYQIGVFIETPNGCKRDTFMNKVRAWVRTYEILGEDGLDHNKPQLTLKEKLMLIERIENGESITYVATSVGRQAASLSKWYKIYLENGVDGLKSLKRGRKPSMSNKNIKSSSESSIKELKEELEYLRAENEYLKKLNALVQKRKDREQKKK